MKFVFLSGCWGHHSHPLWVSGTVLSNPLEFSFSGLGSFPYMNALICTQLELRPQGDFLSPPDFCLCSAFHFNPAILASWTPTYISSNQGDHILWPGGYLGGKLEQSWGSFCFLSSKITAFWCMMSNLEYYCFRHFVPPAFFLRFQVEVKCGPCYFILIRSWSLSFSFGWYKKCCSEHYCIYTSGQYVDLSIE